jgi:hypothetical protein
VRAKPRRAAALAVVALITFSCLTSCATYRVEVMAVQTQPPSSVSILSYKNGWFAPPGDEGQAITLATSICNGMGYSGAIRLGENERCVTHDWGITNLFISCTVSVLEASYHCFDATDAFAKLRQ